LHTIFLIIAPAKSGCQNTKKPHKYRQPRNLAFRLNERLKPELWSYKREDFSQTSKFPFSLEMSRKWSQNEETS